MSEDINEKDKELNTNSSQVQAIKTSEFMKETIKQRPLNKRRLARRLIVTVALAILFGLIACFTFLLLEPIVNKKLNPPEEVVLEDIKLVEETAEEETLPEDMIVEESELIPVELDQIPLGDEQIEQVLDQFELGTDEYLSLSSVVTDVAKETSKSIVSVIGTNQDKDWFDNEYDNENIVSGVIIADNGRDLLILANMSLLSKMEDLEVEFFDKSLQPANLLMMDRITGLGIVAVNKVGMKRFTVENAHIIDMGVTGSVDLKGVPVIALGRPMLYEDSIGIGHFTSCSSLINLPDSNYKLLTTDIYGNTQGTGFLVNIKGQLLGIIDMSLANSDMKNLVCGIGISELKRLIEKMSNGIEVPYLGIHGTDVTDDISESLGVPKGVYITSLEMDSPLMDVGIQSGDIITKFSGAKVISFQEINNIRLALNPEDVINIEFMRQGPEGYTQMTNDVTLAHQQYE